MDRCFYKTKDKIMIKKILLFFLVQIWFSIFVMSQEKNLSELSLSGKVKYIRISYFDTQNNYEKLDSIVKGNRKHSLYLKPEIENTYNRIGNLIEENKLSLVSGEIKSQNIYLYNSNEKLIGYKEVFPNDSIGDRKIYQYDKKGNLLEEISLEKDSSIISKIIYEYNEKGQKKNVSMYVKNNLFSKTIYNYSVNGYTEETTLFSVKKIRKYVNNLIEEQFTYGNKNNLLEKRTYKYNSSRKLLEEKTYSSLGKLVHIYNYEYDNKDNQILFEHHKDDKLITRWKYQYTKFDKYGNWLQRIDLLDLDNGYWYIEERQIKYYD